MIKPPALRPSSLVGVVAPASPIRREFLDKGVEELTRLGFRARLGRAIDEGSRYTAGDAARRAADLVELWEDPEVAAIFCARGGYGSLELLDRLDAERLRAHPKIVLGSSDATALLCFLAARVGLVSFHGPMVAQQMARGRSAYDPDNLLALLGDGRPAGRLVATGVRSLHPGRAEGIVLGGCLSLVTALIGTPYLPRFDGAIVFLEDTAVKPYQIDRMLWQLRTSRSLEGVRGLVFGEMPGCEQHPSQGYALDDVLRDATAGLEVPVLSGFPSGHCLAPAMTLPLGIRASLDHDGLTLLEGAVI
jgi:muramoyltetrapeptide carboxypeptidase